MTFFHVFDVLLLDFGAFCHSSSAMDDPTHPAEFCYVMIWMLIKKRKDTLLQHFGC